MIRVGFGQMWYGFDPAWSGIIPVLEECFPGEIEVCDDPDFLIFTRPTARSDHFSGTRIFYTGENERPPMDRCDWAFTHDYLDHPNHYRLPFYRLRHKPERLVLATNPPPPPAELLDRKFCNFVYSNSRARERIQFFHMLEKYRPVDAAGMVCNNTGVPVRKKLPFVRDYKFTIAFESESYPGYTTEKLADPMSEHSLPIYWGNPLVDQDFDSDSFVNVSSFEEAVDTVIELDRDDDAYLEKMSRPWFHNDEPNEFVKTENIRAQFVRIFGQEA